MSELILRAGLAADVPAVLALWEVAAEDAHRPSDSDVALHRLIERDPEALLLACDDERIIGTLVGGWDGWRFHLYRLAVHPDHRRTGVAQRRPNAVTRSQPSASSSAAVTPAARMRPRNSAKICSCASS